MGRKGFSLLEVMVALALAGALLVTLLYTLNHHLDVAGRHEALTVATALCREKLAEFKRSPLERKGSFPEPYGDYGYSIEVGPSPYPGVSEVSVAVSREKDRVVLRELVRNEVLIK